MFPSINSAGESCDSPLIGINSEAEDGRQPSLEPRVHVFAPDLNDPEALERRARMKQAGPPRGFATKWVFGVLHCVTGVDYRPAVEIRAERERARLRYTRQVLDFVKWFYGERIGCPFPSDELKKSELNRWRMRGR